MPWTLRVAHTADLDRATLGAARALLDDVFSPEMTDDDWEHCLGGLHALVVDGEPGEVLGHAAVVQRRLLHGDRVLRTGYVEGVAVRADRRRQGLGAAMMAELERAIDAAYDVGALGATDEAVPFYRGRGWQVWRGPTSVLSPAGVVRTPDEDGWVYVRPGAVPLDLDSPLTCDWREGDAW